MVKFLEKITVVVARNERQGQVEAMIVSCTKFELSQGQTAKLGIRSSGKGMVDWRKNDVGCPTMNEAFIMNESTKMAKKERIDMLCPIGFMSADEGDTMGDT